MPAALATVNESHLQLFFRFQESAKYINHLQLSNYLSFSMRPLYQLN